MTGACSETMSACEQLVEAVAGLVVVRVVGDDLHAQPLQPPSQRPADRAEPDQPGGLPGDLPGPEPLVGDRAVAKHLAGPDIRVGGQQVAGRREQQGERHLGDGVGVAARGVQHRDARAGGAGDVDVVGVAAGRGDGPQRQLEYRTADRIALHDKHIGALGGDPLGQLLGGVDPQRRLIDPRVVDHIGKSRSLSKPGTAQWGRHQSAKSGHDCPCWRTVTPVSAKDVTIGIDIGTHRRQSRGRR